ncbi:MAG: presqualene diphosphate synthase HpnD [Alphaproteobacteria bacterium]|nr:presqualene diphosphate synthase HpnD [Alphaproteobacteria bacterium]
MTTLTYNEAMADVRKRVKASGSSFAAGMSVLPIPRREAMYALYAFCREVDDIADDSPTNEIREHGLKLWHDRIHALFHDNKAEDAICTALLPAITRFDLVESDFQAIIDGMDLDSRQAICAPSMAELDTYCDHVASAVGRASVRIFGDSSAEAMRVAFHLGRALQLTNILRDLHEDAQRGRLYLPHELLAKHGITSQTPAEILAAPPIPAVCRDLAKTVHHHFDEADKAMKASQWHAMRPARIMRDYYQAIFKRLLKADWQNLAQRVKLPLWEKLALALRGLLS